MIYALVVIVSVAYLVAQKHPALRPPITLETEHLAVLPPHQHENDDSASDTSHHITLNSPVVVAPYDLYVSDIRFELVNAPNETLHHASFVDLSRPNETCSNFSGWRELFVYGSDRMYENNLSMPEGHALLIKRGTPLLLSLMVHNPDSPLGSGDTFNDVYTTLTLTESRADPETLTLVEPYLLHLEDVPCGYAEPDASDVYTYEVPPKTKNHVFSGRGKDDPAASKVFEKATTLFRVAGHLHAWQGGKTLTLYRNEEPLHTFISKPATSSPYLSEIRLAEGSFDIDAGDRLWISAVYDNPHSTPTRGVMAIVGFFYTVREPLQ